MELKVKLINAVKTIKIKEIIGQIFSTNKFNKLIFLFNRLNLGKFDKYKLIIYHPKKV